MVFKYLTSKEGHIGLLYLLVGGPQWELYYNFGQSVQVRM